MKSLSFMIIYLSIVIVIASCSEGPTTTVSGEESTKVESVVGQSGVKDDISNPDVVKVAVSSKDHTTLVKALQTADYVDVLTNAGPFTVFAPTNDAFSGLPAGTLDELLKPENKKDLQNILEYHVYVGVIETEAITEGRILNQVNLSNVTLHAKDGKYMVNDANIIGSVRASNGIIHVIDKVLLPPSK